MRLPAPAGLRERSPAKEPIVKRLMFISLAVATLLVLAFGGWAVKSVRRTPAYA
jgi:hypothetical protein